MSTFNPQKPWDSVLHDLAEDDQWWDKVLGGMVRRQNADGVSAQQAAQQQASKATVLQAGHNNNPQNKRKFEDNQGGRGDPGHPDYRYPNGHYKYGHDVDSNGKKKLMCNFWGTPKGCTRGESCPFSHSCKICRGQHRTCDHAEITGKKNGKGGGKGKNARDKRKEL